MKLFLIVVLVLAILAHFPHSLWAKSVQNAFGSYYLTQEKLGPNLWYFQISEEPFDPSIALVNSLMIKDPERFIVDTPTTAFPVGDVGGRPVLNITPEGEPLNIIFTISPFDPEKRLAGITFYGEQYKTILGLGANFKINDTMMNWMGEVFMPGGPNGARIMDTDQGPLSFFQAPICYALGDEKDSAALFVNETRPLMWDFSAFPWTVSVAGPLNPSGSIGFFVITGEDLPAIRRQYMELVGKPPMPPRGIFYPWVAENLEDPTGDPNNPPALRLQNLVQLNKRLMPDIPNLGFIFKTEVTPQLITDASSYGALLMTKESPYISYNSDNYQKMADQDYLVRNTNSEGGPIILLYTGDKPKTEDYAPGQYYAALVDYTNDAASAYWHSAYRSTFFQSGAQFFHLTGGEPESYSSLAWYRGGSPQGGDLTGPSLSIGFDTSEAHNSQGVPASHSHYAWANPFSLKWLESIFKANSTSRQFFLESKRRFLMTRAGIAGLSRFGAGLITTEPSIFFQSTESQVRAHVGLAGVDYYTTDLVPSLNIYAWDINNDIYELWAARNVLLNLPFIFPDNFSGQPWLAQLLHLKYILEPYYYSLANMAAENGDPLVAHLSYYFQEDQNARISLGEHMLGPSILVGTSGPSSFTTEHIANVYLPKGKWYNYFSNQTVDSTGATVEVDSKYQGYSVPGLFLREGAIIPTWDTPTSFPGRLNIKVFAGSEPSRFTLYEDDGTSLRHQSNNPEFVKTVFVVNPSPQSGTIIFTIRAREGTFPSAPTTRPFYLEFLGIGNVMTVTLDGGEQMRVNRMEDFNSSSSSYFSLGNGRVIFKTLPLDLSIDHSLTIHYALTETS
jgi:alpha-glucosidase